MKLLTTAQMRRCDEATIKVQGISSLALMERAVLQCVAWLQQHYRQEQAFAIVCGTGNNGGDGLAMARLLHERGYAVTAYLLMHSEQLSADATANRARLEPLAGGLLRTILPGEKMVVPERAVVIDALLGSGTNRAVSGWLKDVIEYLNGLANPKISIDLPSGLSADAVPSADAAVVNADYTLTFQQYKRSMLHPEGGRYCGEVAVLDIGLDAACMNDTASDYHTIAAALVRELYRPRSPFGHKGTYGTAMMVGGSYGMMGAAVLMTKAAGRAGAGKVRALVPERGYEIMQMSVPDAMCQTGGDKHINGIAGWEQATAIGCGPGIGKETETIAALKEFLAACDKPMVLDADALNIVSELHNGAGLLKRGTILTPHPKEFERLFGKTEDSMARVERAREVAQQYGLYMVLKDHHSVLVTPEGKCYYSLRGNAGMATGGSGDVLCGIITGLLAQGYPPFAASILGIHLHAVAGEDAAATYSEEAMVAGDIVEGLGVAFRSL